MDIQEAKANLLMSFRNIIAIEHSIFINSTYLIQHQNNPILLNIYNQSNEILNATLENEMNKMIEKVIIYKQFKDKK